MFSYPIIKHLVDYGYNGNFYDDPVPAGWRYTRIDANKKFIYPTSPVTIVYGRGIAPVDDYPYKRTDFDTIREIETYNPQVILRYPIGIFRAYAPGYLDKIIPESSPVIVIDVSRANPVPPGYYSCADMFILKSAINGLYRNGECTVELYDSCGKPAVRCVTPKRKFVIYNIYLDSNSDGINIAFDKELWRIDQTSIVVRGEKFVVSE